MTKTSPPDSCLIIGAGIAGLSAAGVLRSRGIAVTMLDKARGVGGRMATRRVAVGAGNERTATFDHGAQFLTARSDQFKVTLEQWQKAGVAREWFRGQPGSSKSGDGHPRYCGVGGMAAIAKHLAHGLNVVLSETVLGVGYRGGSWSAKTSSGAEYRGKALILTPPVPQSLVFLKAGGVELTPADMEVLTAIGYDPCVCVLALLDGPSHVPAPGTMRLEGGPVAWLADNYQKDVSEYPGAVTIHASPEWSREHYDESDDDLAAQLCESVREILGAEPMTTQVRRWRYSKAVGLHTEACLVAEHALPLVFAGDAFAPSGVANVESAMLSGLAAARMIVEAG